MINSHRRLPPGCGYSEQVGGCPVLYGLVHHGDANFQWWPSKSDLDLRTDVTGWVGLSMTPRVHFSTGCGEAGHCRCHDLGLVALRDLQLRPADDPDGVAQRGGLYLISDGRGGGGGQQRFAPINSWPDKREPAQGPARRGRSRRSTARRSRGPTMILTGNVAREDDGLQDLRLPAASASGARRRRSGPETTGLHDERYSKNCSSSSLGAVQMVIMLLRAATNIYLVAAAVDIRVDVPPLHGDELDEGNGGPSW